MDIDKAVRLAITCHQRGDIQQAERSYKKILECQPDNANVLHWLGVINYQLRNYDQSIRYIKRALHINPKFAEAHYNLGVVLHEKCQLDEAISCYQEAIQLNPNLIDAYCNLGVAFKTLDRIDEALPVLSKALQLNPKHFFSRWAYCMSHLLIIYPDQGSIQISRQCYSNELNNLSNMIFHELPHDIATVAEVVGQLKPFYLTYQGLNDKELQRLYGSMVCRIMHSRYPQFAERLNMPTCMSGKPLRIGIVSGFFYHHSNWKIPIKGWIENIDRRRFVLYGYYTGKEKDQETAIAKKYFEYFREDIDCLEELCRIIRGDNLHVLVFPEIGMDSMTLRLASLRLAPVQCTSWGHPETSGLPTIDYFLSSELMEPPDAEAHYTEKLISLPNLSIYYEPLKIPFASINRNSFKLRADSILYLCCQSLFKYLPLYDEIYPRIAKAVNNCQFLFISHQNSLITDKFSRRLRQAFSSHNLSYEDHVVFLPPLNPSRYNALNNLADIYLDSVGWSGCNSTFEAIACNLPIVTLSGELMRGRHGSAILTMIGLTELIATNLDDYISLAVKLGQDGPWRQHISDKISKCKHLAYRDRTCITALEDFLEKAVKERLLLNAN
jgi:protein O-GlcNAc transferase